MAVEPAINDEWHGVRAIFYDIFAQCFLGRFRTQLKMSEMYNRLTKLQMAAQTGVVLPHGLLEELKRSLEDVKSYSLVIRDWRRLLHPDGAAYLHPYESVYSAQYKVRSSKISGQRVEQEVEFFYRHAGIDMKKYYEERADHVGVELAFMEALIKREIQAKRQGHKSLAHCYTRWQRQFLDNHLGYWFGEFSRQLLAEASTEFYRVLAKVAWNYVRIDQKILNSHSTKE